jgi:WD40 repeat protein
MGVQCLEKPSETALAVETTCLRQEATLIHVDTGEVLRSYPLDESANAIVQTSNSGGHRGAVKALAFSPVSPIFATGGEDGMIYLWDVETGLLTGLPLMYRGGPITALAFSLQGDTLAAAYANLDLILWDTSTGQVIGGPLVGAGSTITALAFDPPGKVLYSFGMEGTALAWNADPEAWIALNCNLAQRNFTQAEWKEFMPDQDYRITCEQYPAGE